jgi:uncharacterized phage protein gp47/JayE
MAPTWGVTPAGFVAKPTSAILSDIESSELATMNPALDLSPTGPQGQLNGIVANAISEIWQLSAVVFNSNNRAAAEGAGLDNIGNEVGIPRESATYTQVLCDLVFTSGDVGNTYAANTLVANVTGTPSLTFSNFASLHVTSTSMNGVLFQAQNIGATPSINPNTLTTITNPISGWVSITNPGSQSILGTNEELDAAYAARQQEELAEQGSCNPPATVAALIQLAADQSPPITLTVTEFENTTNTPASEGAITLPPHSFAIVAYDPTGWVSGAGVQLIGQTIWENKPAGIQTVGTTSVVITDPNFGPTQNVYYTVPTALPLFVTAVVVVRNNFTFASVQADGRLVLIAASTAPTPPSGTPPNGQLLPGGYVIGSQLEAVIMSVPGVQDVQSLTFDFVSSPVNTAPLAVSPTQVATLTMANIANIVIEQGFYP